MKISDVTSLGFQHLGGKLDGKTGQRFMKKCKKGKLWLTCSFRDDSVSLSWSYVSALDHENNETIKTKEELIKLIEDICQIT